MMKVSFTKLIKIVDFMDESELEMSRSFYLLKCFEVEFCNLNCGLELLKYGFMENTRMIEYIERRTNEEGVQKCTSRLSSHS